MFSQSELVIISTLQNFGEKHKECSWFVNTEPGAYTMATLGMATSYIRSIQRRHLRARLYLF